MGGAGLRPFLSEAEEGEGSLLSSSSVGRRRGRYATVGRLGIRLRLGFFQRVDEQRLKSLLFQIY